MSIFYMDKLRSVNVTDFWLANVYSQHRHAYTLYFFILFYVVYCLCKAYTWRGSCIWLCVDLFAANLAHYRITKTSILYIYICVDLWLYAQGSLMVAVIHNFWKTYFTPLTAQASKWSTTASVWSHWSCIVTTLDQSVPYFGNLRALVLWIQIHFHQIPYPLFISAIQGWLFAGHILAFIISCKYPFLLSLLPSLLLLCALL